MLSNLIYLIFILILSWSPSGFGAANNDKEQADTQSTFLKGELVVPKAPVGDEDEPAPLDWDKTIVSRSVGQVGDRPDAESQILNAFKNGQLAYFFQRYEEAMAYWLPLAKKGFADAQSNVAWMYQNGLGVEKDLAQAVNWYNKAATQQQAVAQNNLGSLHDQGLGVERDLNKAFTWFEKSANNNYRFGQYNLGLAYLEGKGTEVNKKLAEFWLRKALASGVDQAKAKLDDLKVLQSTSAH
ncbi:MAG: sel1 repeat family protein [Gammaproteobacteria bacterium]|nr:sel1 repeat family protein [Gammaproteobacteria bacterium]MDH5691564.1 sel1 repeat family protein [Gammaproteobacteria bacterium]